MDAFRALRVKLPTAKLIVAGYDAAKYATSHTLSPLEGFEVHNSLSCTEFECVIGMVDLAIQLRAANRGESSGAIAQLLSLGIPVVTSKRGAFEEYEGAVKFLPEPVAAPDLVHLIMEEHQHFAEWRRREQEYSEKHSPRAFCDQLGELLEAILVLGAVEKSEISSRPDGKPKFSRTKAA